MCVSSEYYNPICDCFVFSDHPVIRAQIGQKATLPCVLQNNGLVRAAKWIRTDETKTVQQDHVHEDYVLMYRGKSLVQDGQLDSYKGRVELVDPTNGNYSLIISNVTLNDDATYGFLVNKKKGTGGFVKDPICKVTLIAENKNLNDKDKNGEDKTGEDKTGEDKNGEDKNGENKTGEDKNGWETESIIELIAGLIAGFLVIVCFVKWLKGSGSAAPATPAAPAAPTAPAASVFFTRSSNENLTDSRVDVQP